MSYLTLTPGRLLFFISNLFYCLGAFVADFNKTHVYNPTWPPHAKFHNGQTMSLSILLALASLYLFFQPTPTRTHRKSNVFMAAVIASFYCSAGLSAIAYPGTAWADPEYQGVQGGQAYVFVLQVLMTWTAYALEIRGIRKGTII